MNIYVTRAFSWMTLLVLFAWSSTFRYALQRYPQTFRNKFYSALILLIISHMDTSIFTTLLFSYYNKFFCLSNPMSPTRIIIRFLEINQTENTINKACFSSYGKDKGKWIEFFYSQPESKSVYDTNTNRQVNRFFQ